MWKGKIEIVDVVVMLHGCEGCIVGEVCVLLAVMMASS